MADLDAGYDEQDQSELFDEDATHLHDGPPGEEAEPFGDLVDVYDATSARGDADQDEDEAEIGDNLDDDEIVARGREDDDDHDDNGAEDDATLAEGDGRDAFASPDEVELEYVGDLNDLAGASSAAQSLESDSLSDRDLRELDYKDEFTRDDADADAPPAR